MMGFIEQMIESMRREGEKRVQKEGNGAGYVQVDQAEMNIWGIQIYII